MVRENTITYREQIPKLSITTPSQLNTIETDATIFNVYDKLTVRVFSFFQSLFVY
jgi:hypothetical protein